MRDQLCMLARHKRAHVALEHDLGVLRALVVFQLQERVARKAALVAKVFTGSVHLHRRGGKF